MDAPRHPLEEDGFHVIPAVCSEEHCEALIEEIPPADMRAGSRQLLRVPAFRALAAHLRSHPLIRPHLPKSAIAIQCSLFAKGPGANWAVAPHQDLSIPVAERTGAPQCAGWSLKEGVLFTQPPAAVLASLLAVRLQLDPDAEFTGPLQVVAGSHLLKRLSAPALSSLVATRSATSCVVPRGGALLLKPLAVHSSAKSRSTGFRRVLHFLYGPQHLPLGLRWAVEN